MVTAETGSCELIFSFTCIDYNVKHSKSIHLNVTPEKKELSVKQNIAELEKKTSLTPPPLNAWIHMVPIEEPCLISTTKIRMKNR